MTELQIGLVFGCALLVAAVSLLVYLVIDLWRMPPSSTFHAPDYPSPARRTCTTMPTPLPGERR